MLPPPAPSCQIRAAPSAPAVTAKRPSGLVSRAFTAAACTPTRPSSGLTPGSHTRAEPSSPAVTTVAPSGAHCASNTPPWLPLSSAIRKPSDVLNTLAVRSRLERTTNWPSGLKDAVSTRFNGPKICACSVMSGTCQTTAPPTSLAATSNFPLRLNSAWRRWPSPGMLACWLPVSTSHRRAVLSLLVVATQAASGLNAALVIPRSGRSCSSEPVATSKMRACWWSAESVATVTRRPPSPSSVAEVTVPS